MAFGREDKYPVLFHGRITSAATPPAIRAKKQTTASDTNARSIPSSHPWFRTTFASMWHPKPTAAITYVNPKLRQ
jgi:hypothetical protein